MKKMLALVLALAMCLGCAALAEETALVYALGAPMPDFTFTDINGVSHTLSETLGNPVQRKNSPNVGKEV